MNWAVCFCVFLPSLLSLHSLHSYVFELGQHRKSLLPWPVNQIKSNWLHTSSDPSNPSTGGLLFIIFATVVSLFMYSGCLQSRPSICDSFCAAHELCVFICVCTRVFQEEGPIFQRPPLLLLHRMYTMFLAVFAACFVKKDRALTRLCQAPSHPQGERENLPFHVTLRVLAYFSLRSGSGRGRAVRTDHEGDSAFSAHAAAIAHDIFEM